MEEREGSLKVKDMTRDNSGFFDWSEQLHHDPTISGWGCMTSGISLTLVLYVVTPFYRRTSHIYCSIYTARCFVTRRHFLCLRCLTYTV